MENRDSHFTWVQIMTIQSIVSYVGETNLVSKLDKDELAKIARDVIERADQDKTTMKEWEECVTEGIKLCKPEFKARNEPWAGAANFKSTILTEAANTFGNRASVEVMRELKLVGADVIGAETVKAVIDRKASQTNQLKSELEPLAAQVAQMKEAGQDTAELDAVIQQFQQQIQANEKTVKEKRLAMRKKYDKADRRSSYLIGRSITRCRSGERIRNDCSTRYHLKAQSLKRCSTMTPLAVAWQKLLSGLTS